jgi:3-methyladenine DNA glycosylase Tag
MFEVFRSGLEWDFLKGKRSGFRVSNMHGKKNADSKVVH